MIKLGDTVEFKEGFFHEAGLCKEMQLLKWSSEDAYIRGNKYLVVGRLFNDKAIVVGHTFLTEGTLAHCRAFILQLLKDEDILINS